MTAATDIRKLMRALCEPVGACYAVQRVRSMDESAALARDMEEHLRESEQQDCAKFRSFKRQAEFCAGRMAAKHALAQAPLSISDSEFEIERDAMGAPRLRALVPGPRQARNSAAKLSQTHLSISHSNGFAVAVAAPWHIGIDLEAVEARPDALIRYFYCAAEQGVLRGLEGVTFWDTVHQFWTRKESACKLTGQGARLDLRDIDATQPRTCLDEQDIEWSSVVFARFAASIAFATNAPVRVREAASLPHWK